METWKFVSSSDDDSCEGEEELKEVIEKGSQKRKDKEVGVMESLEDLDSKIYSILYQTWTGKKRPSNISFIFHLSNSSRLKVLKKLSSLNLPSHWKIYLTYNPKSPCQSTFVSSLLPSNSLKIRILSLNSQISHFDSYPYVHHPRQEFGLQNFTKYKDLTKAIQLQNTNFQLHNFYFWEKSFLKILAWFRNKNECSFTRWKLPLSEKIDCHKALKGSRIKSIGFHSWGRPKYWYWTEFPIRFDNLIQSLCTSQDFQENLKEFIQSPNEFSEGYVQKVLNAQGLEKVTLFEYENEYN